VQSLIRPSVITNHTSEEGLSIREKKGRGKKEKEKKACPGEDLSPVIAVNVFKFRK
jgi:hypothetical protein